ncbi:MAG: ABC transporter permease [Polaromonas sp.]|uniref:ABC transporter permease n=1 Tax=Polaromonas sp. TaxID=1869339 RepID=UPI0025F5CCD4|nr:ABC transporter permease [Polaromonas sp.]MBI2726972.1 ABC transporter permease [Polaromonas sp.]
MSKPEVSAAGSAKKSARSTDAGSHMLWTLTGFAILLAMWQVVVLLGRYPEVVLPGPWSVAAGIFKDRALLFTHALVTLREIGVGFALAVLIGVPIGAAVAFSKPLSRLLMPLMVVSNSIPKVAIAPLFLLWFGYGQITNIVLAVLVAIFPIVINTTLGLTHIEPDLIRLGKVMGGSPARIFWQIRVPTALPSIFAGLKLAITLATIGAIVGEMIAGQAGLGYLAQYASGQLLTVMAFGAIVVMSALGVALFYAIAWLEVIVVGPNRRAA